MIAHRGAHTDEQTDTGIYPAPGLSLGDKTPTAASIIFMYLPLSVYGVYKVLLELYLTKYVSNYVAKC